MHDNQVQWISAVVEWQIIMKCVSNLWAHTQLSCCSRESDKCEQSTVAEVRKQLIRVPCVELMKWSQTHTHNQRLLLLVCPISFYPTISFAVEYEAKMYPNIQKEQRMPKSWAPLNQRHRGFLYDLQHKLMRSVHANMPCIPLGKHTSFKALKRFCIHMSVNPYYSSGR